MIPENATGPLLEVTDLKTHFPIRGGVLGRTAATVRAAPRTQSHQQRPHHHHRHQQQQNWSQPRQQRHPGCRNSSFASPRPAQQLAEDRARDHQDAQCSRPERP